MFSENGIHRGHRQRMRRRFKDNSPRFFDTYELLEILLYHTIACKDTNPIAKALFMRFGSIDAVLSAPKEELMLVPGVGERVADYITAVGKITDYQRISAADECASYDDYHRLGRMISEYFDTRVASDAAVVAFAFDNAMRLIGSKLLYEYDFESGAVRADAFIEFAISSRAAVIASAHLHKRGPLFPTVGDIESGKLVEEALSGAGILHIEHYVISGRGYIGIMNNITKAFHQMPAIKRFFESKEAAVGD